LWRSIGIALTLKTVMTAVRVFVKNVSAAAATTVRRRMALGSAASAMGVSR
jgi:hypothetical protein